MHTHTHTKGINTNPSKCAIFPLTCPVHLRQCRTLKPGRNRFSSVSQLTMQDVGTTIRCGPHTPCKSRRVQHVARRQDSIPPSVERGEHRCCGLHKAMGTTFREIPNSCETASTTPPKNIAPEQEILDHERETERREIFERRSQGDSNNAKPNHPVSNDLSPQPAVQGCETYGYGVRDHDHLPTPPHTNHLPWWPVNRYAKGEKEGLHLRHARS